MATFASPRRCAVHRLIAGRDGLCAMCKEQEARKVGLRKVIGASVVIVAAVAGVLALRGASQGVSSVQPAAQTRPLEGPERKRAVEAAKGDVHVRMYMARSCPRCADAKEWLTENQIRFEELD